VAPLMRRGDDDEPDDQVTLLPLSPGYFPATSEVTIEVGKSGGKLAANIAELIETPAPRLHALFNATSVKLWHVPSRNLLTLDQAIQKSGGRISGEPRHAEGRIYRAAPEVLEQVGQFISNNK